MENKINKAIDQFINVPETDEEFQKKVAEQKKKFIKNDKSIVELLDKQYLTEDGRLLLTE